MQARSKWFEHKKRLTDQGHLHPIFTTLHLERFELEATHGFEPLLIARHSQRLGELVDRCLALRKDIRELEVLAVKAETDYELFNSTSALDEQVELLRLQIGSKTDDQIGFKQAASSFATTSTLEQGLADIAKGRDAALGQDLLDSGQIKDLITEKYQALRKYQDDYHSRYTEPGNAHNFGERATLLLQVLTVLMQEALERADALAKGVKQVYNAELTEVPISVTLQAIDEFAVWALTTIQSLSRVAEQEAVSEIIIPLVQPWLPSLQPLITQVDFDKAVSGATTGKLISFSFDFPSNELLDPQTRLKGIGISFGNDFALQTSGIDRNQTADTFSRLAVKISTPAQLAADGTTYFRPPIQIGNVGLHGTSIGGTTVDGTPIENVSPFGTWNIDVHTLIVWKDGAVHPVSQMGLSDPIRDLKLSLRFYVPGNFQ